MRLTTWTVLLWVIVGLGWLSCTKKDTQPQTQAQREVDEVQSDTLGARFSPEVQTILDAAIAASGGLERLKAIQGWTAQSKGVYLGIPYKATSTYHPGELRMDILSLNSPQMVMVMGDKNCWQKTGKVVMGCTDAERSSNKNYMGFEQTVYLWPLLEGSWNITASQVTLDNRSHPALTVSHPDLSSQGQLVFDAESHLLIQTRFPGSMGELQGDMISRLRNHKPFCNGVQIATDIVTEFGQQEMTDEQVLAYQCGPVDHNLFIQPVQVEDGTLEQKIAMESTIACWMMRGAYDQFPNAMEHLMQAVGKRKLNPLGAPMLIYQRAPPNVQKTEKWLTEVCVPVGAPPPKNPEKLGDFVLRQLAPTKVLALYGLGDYAQKSGEMAKRLMDELARRKLRAKGALRQVTYMDPTKVQASQLVSEMQVPIQ